MKIVKANDEGILFDNGDVITCDYSPSCCEYNYASFKDLEEIALKFEKIGNFPLIYSNKPSRDFLFAVNWEKDRDPIIKVP